MRLKDTEIEAIKSVFNEVFGKGEIYLFGSRVDDNKRGGDIDLYLMVDTEDKFNKKIKFRAKLYRLIGERKIDVVFSEDENRLIEKEARKWGIKL
ncbi:MAG: nucleotidyltransferase domain-containing protein [Epsilonproteobacteria bacterium]|nr:nucleotidyltransferase domain-containing protein [Campylobacterota bacterium]